MKQPKLKNPDPIGEAPSSAKEIALEFTRISQLTASGRGDEAWRAANDLYAKYPTEATPNFIIALILTESDQKADALSYAEAAVKLSPNNAGYHVFLGKLYVDLELLEYAPTVLEKAFSLDQSMFQAPWAMAKYYYGSGQGNKALPYYQKALMAAPKQSINIIKLGYAKCFSAIGQIDKAEAIYSELAGDPALRREVLKHSALLRKVDQNSAIAVNIRGELATTEMGNKDRSALLLALGRLYENGREYDEAFQNFQASRKLLTNKHDIHRFRAKIDDWINVITPDAVTKFHGFGDSSSKPIFVVGMPRSGTTLTEQIIAAHSQAEGIGEIERISRLSTNICGSKGAEGILAKMAEVGPANWKGVPQQYLNLLNVLAPDARHAVDKMPHNFCHIGFIHFCFPKAKIIHCNRNPLDNFISAFQNQMISSHGYSYDQIDYGEYYVEYMRLMNHWKSIFPESIYDSSYEMLTADPETAVHNVLKFLELPWEEACLKFNERESTVKTFSSQQVRKPINTESIARWRNYEKHLAPIIAVLEKAGIQY